MLLLAFTIGKAFGQNYDFLTTTQNKTPIFLSRNSVFALVWANRGPSPAPRQRAASPSPWERGVNGLANHRPTLICHPKILRSFANHSRTVASVPRPTIVSKAIHSPPSLDLWSLARARRGGGSRVSGAGVGLLGQVPLEKCSNKQKVPLEKCCKSLQVPPEKCIFAT